MALDPSASPAAPAATRALRVACVINSLRGGGAELVLSRLAEALAARGHSVAVVTFSPPDTDVHRLPAGVTRLFLDTERHSSSFLERFGNLAKRVRGLRTAIRRCAPDVIVSFTDVNNVVALLANLSLRLPIVISERTDPRAHRLDRITGLLRESLYGTADALVVQTKSTSEWAARLPNPPATQVIPNPVFPSSSEGASGLVPQGDFVLGVGRLGPEKGFDVLIRAFARARQDHPTLRLVVLGEGPCRPELERLVQSLGLSDAVALPGYTTPAPWLRAASVFVLSSRYEGFPNALAEAMEAGAPIVTTRCPSGPAEMVADGEAGILVPVDDVAKMARAISRLLSEREFARALGQRAREFAHARFAPELVWDAWEATLFSAISRHRSMRGPRTRSE